MYMTGTVPLNNVGATLPLLLRCEPVFFMYIFLLLLGARVSGKLGTIPALSLSLSKETDTVNSTYIGRKPCRLISFSGVY